MTTRRRQPPIGNLLAICAAVVALLLLVAFSPGDGAPEALDAEPAAAMRPEAPRVNSFDQLDQNGNRLIERREAQRQPGLDGRFAALDRNGDRGLDRYEFDAFEHGAGEIDARGRER